MPDRVVDEKGLERALEHAGELVSGRVRAEAMKTLVNHIWKYRDGKRRYGICSACKAVFELPEGWAKAHKEAAICPACGRESSLMDAWRGHKSLYQEFYMAEWRKSTIDPDTAVMVGSLVCRDLRHEHPERAEIEIVPIALYVYRYGWGAVCFKRYAYAWNDQPGAWERRRNCQPGNSSGGLGAHLRVLAPEAWFFEAIQGTRFETMWGLLEPDVGRYTHTDHTPEMESIAKRPYLEYLAKMGQLDLAREGLGCSYPQGAINHQGKTAQAVLGLNGQQLREVKRDKLILTGNVLAFNRLLKKHGIAWPAKKVIEGRQKLDDIGWLGEALPAIPPALREKAVKYALGFECGRGGRIDCQVHRDLRDYWGQLVTLKADMSDEQVVFPKDMQEAHNRATARIKYIEDQTLKEGIEQFKRKLKDYSFRHGKLMMRPMADAEEIVREGNALRHCVGGYAKRYADGKTILCVLRRIDALDEPYRTICATTARSSSRAARSRA